MIKVEPINKKAFDKIIKLRDLINRETQKAIAKESNKLLAEAQARAAHLPLVYRLTKHIDL